jgi:outer membrane protein insertion porin family
MADHSNVAGWLNRLVLHSFMTKFYFFIIFTVAVLPGYPEELSNPISAFFGKTIRRIDFAADMTLDRSHFDPYLGIKPGEKLTQTAVKGAIQFLYETGRFSEIKVEASLGEDGVNILFKLHDNYYFNRFSIIGNVDLKDRSLRELVALPVGQRFTDEKLEDSRRAVLKFLNERGFYLADATARPVMDDKTRYADTVFQVNAGKLATIRSIEVEGVPSPEIKAVLEQFGYKQGKRYDRSRLNSRVENLRKYFIQKGYLAAVPKISELFEPENGTVALKINVANFGRVRIVVQGFKIDKIQLPRLLPALSGEGINPDTLEEGLNNLKDYLEDRGYPEAEVTINEAADNSGVRVFRYGIVPNHKFTVVHINFKGNRLFPDQEMLASVKIQPAAFMQSTAYSAANLDDDVESLKALYESRGYLEAKVIPLVEPLDSGNKLDITYTCEEGRMSRVQSLDIHGNESVKLKDLMSKIKLAPGAPYSPSLAEQDRQSLISAYNDFGFLRAQVTVRVGASNAEGAYPVEFHIEEGNRTIADRIFVLGAGRTRESIINKRIKIRSNEPLSFGKLLQTQRALYELGIFDQVRVTPQNSESAAPYQDVVVRLQESNRFTMSYGFGYQETEKLRGTLEFSDLNFLGLAKRADIRLRGSSIAQEALFNLRQPQFRALPVDSYFTFSYLQQRDVSFDSKRFNVSYQFSRPLTEHSWGMLRYNFKNVRLSNLQVSVSELGREDSPCNLSTFSGAFIKDSRDNYLDPTKGFFSSTDLGVTTKLLGSNDYVSFFSQNSYYHGLSRSLLMAGSIRFGAAHPYGGDTDLPISERYFAGGGSSLRGFETDFAGPLDPVTNKPVGGNALVIGSMEIRVPLFRFLHLAGFYDTGNVFRNVSDIDFTGFSHTVGLGLRIKTPFGPLRADYGYNLNLSQDLRNRGLSREHLFITIGPPF